MAKIWQGVIPENDIVGIQKNLNDALPMQGGIDVPAIDSEGMPEEKVRAEIRRAFDTYCGTVDSSPASQGVLRRQAC